MAIEQVPLDAPPEGAHPEDAADDLTVIGAPATEVLQVGVSELVALGPDGAEGAGRDAPAVPAGRAQDASKPPKDRPRRRRVVVVVLSSIAVIGLVAAGLAAAIIHYGVYGHVVPKVVGENITTATANLENSGLRLSVGDKRYDVSVLAGDVIGQSITPGRHERAGTIVIVSESKGPPPVPVPGVTGRTQTQARAMIAAGHLHPVVELEYSETVGPGKVIDESPPSTGGDRPWESKVILYVSKGPHPRIIPGVVGATLAAAIQDLDGVQLRYKQAAGQYSTTVPQGDVISETPPAKSSVRRYSVVTLVVSLGEPYVVIPHLRGLTVKKARSELLALGLHVELYDVASGGIVLSSNPAAGSSIREGQSVTLYVI